LAIIFETPSRHLIRSQDRRDEKKGTQQLPTKQTTGEKAVVAIRLDSTFTLDENPESTNDILHTTALLFFFLFLDDSICVVLILSTTPSSDDDDDDDRSDLHRSILVILIIPTSLRVFVSRIRNDDEHKK